MRVIRQWLATSMCVIGLASIGRAQTPDTPTASPAPSETAAVAAPVPVPAQTAPPTPPAHAVENADVIAMVDNKLSDDAILGMIAVNETHFDVSAAGLIALKKAGVSDRVLNGMLEATQRHPASTPPAPEAATGDAHAPAPGPQAPSPAAATAATPMGMPPGVPPMDPQRAAAMQNAMRRMQAMGYSMPGMPGMAGGGFPHVLLVLAATKTDFNASTAQRAMTKAGMSSGGGASALASLARQALAFGAIAAGPAGMGGMAALSGVSRLGGMFGGGHPSMPMITYAWGLPGAHSERTLAAPTPAFELTYGDIPGIDPDAYEPALVRLALTPDNYRLIGATKQSMGAGMMMGGSNELPDWITEDRVAARVKKRERGSYELSVDKALPPGEYALVLRPIKSHHAAASAFSNTDQLTSAVWDFSLPSTLPAAPAKAAH
jgi:hypothetical protein